MKARLMMFALGVLARVVAEVANRYSDWLFARLRQASTAGFNVWADLCEFGDWLLSELASQFTGRQVRHAYAGDGWEPDVYGR